MGENSAVIHCNPGLSHQVRIARALREGFAAHGLPAAISNSPTTPAELHVVLGPWFALKEQRGQNVLYIDRAYWGDPDCVSVHRMVGDEKHYDICDKPRPHPDYKPWRSGDSSIYLCDYGQTPPVEFQEYRLHPADGGTGDLLTALDGHAIAYGRRTTALVDAAIAGLMVVSDDPHSPVAAISGAMGDRGRWLNRLAWHNWSIQEIARGEMWEHL